MTALVAAVAATAMMTATAEAATVTLTGDDGTPVALAPGANLALRNVNPTLAVSAVAPEKYYDVSTVGPVTNATSTRTCFSVPSNLPVDYQGNGTYTVTVTSYTDTRCTTGKQTATYQFTINASVTLSGPAGRLLTRAPNDFRTRMQNLAVGQNPNARTEVRYALRGTIGPDGGIAGPSKEGFVDTTSGFVGLALSDPGRYVVVARAVGSTGAAGQFFSPWSAPVVLNVKSPFDFLSAPFFLDSRGPSYKLRARLGEDSARGKVKISFAKGKRGKWFSAGKAKVRGGVLKKRFTLRSPGVYRVRFTYKGGAAVWPGKVLWSMKIERRFF